MNIAHNLERNHRLFPHKPALIFEGNHLTYQELNTLSNQIANGLADYGIGRGDRVAIFLPNIPAFMSSYFAIQKLGAVAVTLNSGLKAQETSFMLNDCQAKIVITTAALRPQLVLAELPHVKQVFIAEGEAKNDMLLSDLMAQASREFQAIDLERDEPAVIIYTSGTTGFPKGATLSQGNIVSNVRLTMYNLRLAADDRVLLFLPAFHNYGQYATFNSCFDAGATLILHREFEPQAILDSIEQNKVTTFFGVPTIYTLLYDQATPAQFASIKRFISAGASLPVEVSNKWQAKFGLVINQIYGLTECSMACFNHYFEPRPGTIGTPVEGTELKIVNSDGQAVAKGELGEIVVRGPNVMLGYWNRPEATAEAIKDGWFYTGDMGRQDEAGYVTIVDRRKDMVNVGGEKVYPSEVEQVLYQHPAVLEAAVYGVPETLMGEEVRASVILKTGAVVTAAALTEFCRRALADYKVPSVIQFVESLPKGRTGKVLKRVLREEAVKSSEELGMRSEELKPTLNTYNSSFITLKLTEWLRENLGEAVAADKPFNEYGLTSLLAVRLVAALNEWLGTAHEPMMVWNYPTIETLVNYLIQAPSHEQVKLSDEQTLITHHSSLITTPEPIAIIGLGCRFPGGADTLDKFWDILQHGVDTVAEIPADRWDIERYYDPHPETLGKMYTKMGSFLTEVDKFDAAFFGLPPIDAHSLDPQQRILLEVTWEALENAGLSPHELRHSQTGMFIGSFWDDYSALNLYNDTPENIDAYRMISSLRGMHAGRLSYNFQFHGPSMQVDTACSSSLLAIHLACQSLRAQECHLAIAGGATLFLSPENLIGLSRTHAISADGRSKTFAANADGFGVGEGVGAVVLKRLSDAERDGDTVLAIIRGSAVNHDGPSNGLTAPNGLAQEAMLRQALQNARLSPDQLDYIETHGTGTVLGDPIEIDALARVFAANRSHPLIIGSVKSNIGHLSAAAGMASLMKVVLSMQHGLIPPSLHFSDPNPHIRWQELPFMVPTQPITWPRPSKLAGISSFGMTGTNVHVIVEGVDSRPQMVDASTSYRLPSTCIFTLSGKTEQALRDQVVRYRDYLARHLELDLADVCYTANTGRVHFEHRVAVVADNLDELRQKLEREQNETGESREISPVSRPFAPSRSAFLFTGQGSQYVDMGRELYETQPLFRQIMTECDQILRPHLDVPLLEIIFSPSASQSQADKLNADRLNATIYTQPALFALEYALAKVWQSWGIEPEVVMGHSVGEYVAACVAGVFSLEDGLKLIAARGRLMQQLPEQGSMVAVQLAETDLLPYLQPYSQQVSIASYNAPQSVVISGQNAAIEQIVTQLQADGVKCNPLNVSHAFHSPLMTPMLAEFEQVAQSITYHAPQLKLVSNLTGQVITQIDAAYWVAHVSAPVRFAQGMATLFELGINTFIEVGPKPTLLGLGQQIADSLSVSQPVSQDKNLVTPYSLLPTPALWLPSLYIKQQTDWRQMLESLGQFHVHGGQVDWRKFDEPYSRHKISLPTYPFQRKRYWLDQRTKSRTLGEAEHPLVGPMMRLSNGADIYFQTTLSVNQPSYLNDHRVFEQVILPGTAYLEMALAAGKEIFENEPFHVTNITFQQPLKLTDAETTVQIVFSPLAEGYRWQIFSLLAEHEWLLHSAGEIFKVAVQNLEPLPLAELRSHCPTEISTQTHYENCAEQGMEYGSEFQVVTELYGEQGVALGLVRLSDSLQLEVKEYQLHPALLDGCLQVSAAAMGETSEAYLPFALERLQLYATWSHQVLWSYVQLRGEGSTPQMDITLLTETGEVVAELSGFMLRAANREAILGSRLRTDWLYQLTWQPSALPQSSSYDTETGHWLILGDQALSQPLVELLQAKGEKVELQGFENLAALDYRGVIYLAKVSEGEDVPAAALRISSEVLSLAQGLIQGQAKPRLWLVSSGELATSVLWGLGRTIMWEHPELGCSCLDMSAETSAESLFETLWQADKENQIKLRDGQRQVARLTRYVEEKVRNEKLEIRNENPLTSHFSPLNSYLITGGLGGLGLKVATWLAEQGARYLVLSGRHGAQTVETRHALSLLETLGAQVLVVKADISQEAEVARLLAECEQFAPLRGIIHAAGLLDDGIILQQTPDRFAKVFAPKVWGSWHLHQASQNIPLDFFVSFSSAASLLGNGGQANYAAANAFMDSLMAQRQAMGLPGLSINWGGWSEVGLAVDLVSQEEAISPEQGVALLGYLLSQSATQVGVIPNNWVKFGKQLPVGANFPVLSHFLKAKAITSSKSALRQQLAQATAEERFVLLKTHIRAEIQTILGVAPTDEQGFFDLGMDSLMSIQLGNRLAASLEFSLPATLTLGYPTVTQLAHYLAELLADKAETAIVPIKTLPVISTILETEPIAIVGMGCRFPGGANNIEQFWQLLHEGQDGVIEIPSSRWRADNYYDPTIGTPNKMYMKQGGFLQYPIEQFDPQFFGIPPIEAQHLDPQHRLLLEVTWEAMEHAGLPADKLPLQTGIFVGIMEPENSSHEPNYDIYATTGTGMAMATGRLAYILGVQGPNMAINTVCSSSLVALHLACQSLRAGECEVALSGGVNVMLAPQGHIALSAMQALSPDGRCKTFAASADGFGRGEGCGMVVLKRLSEAQREGDTIWGVIRGSAVNHDGRSSGLTVPNKVAQTAVIRSALAKAQVAGTAVSYVEAHGTGTKLGDPNELWGLTEALGERETPLFIGSVKTNIGHLEAAAGIAGVIKVALSLHHGEIPPHLHFDKPNPLIDWANSPFVVPTELTPWPRGEQPRLAGISSFGLSGTNAHVILGEASQRVSPSASQPNRPSHILTLSGKSEQALCDQVTRYQDYLVRHPELDLADVCYTANTGRVHFEHRVAVVSDNLDELRQKLERERNEKGEGRENSRVSRPFDLSRSAFLFTGQGSQYVDMGRELYETQPLFRQIMTECDQILRPYLDIPLLELLYPTDKGQQTNDRLNETQYTQPTLFALEYALAKVWQSWGIEPELVMGHSVGEYVAACVAGVFSLADGLKLIAARGRLMQNLPEKGRMVAVQLAEADLLPYLQPYSQQVSIASYNAPQSVVISGQSATIEQIVTKLQAEGVKCNPLNVSHAFHSPLMTPMLAEFEQVARSITYHAPKLKLVSNVSGQVITKLDAAYWVAHVSAPVRFAEGMATLFELGINTFIEVGPKPTLLGLGQQIADSLSASQPVSQHKNLATPYSLLPTPALWLPSLYPKQQTDWWQLLESLGQFHVHGGQVDWRKFDEPYSRHKVSLPTYPFQRKRYWLDQRAKSRTLGETGHPLIGTLRRSPTNTEISFQTTLSVNQPSYLNDHRVFEQVILPGTAYLEMALAAGKEIFEGQSFELTNITFQQPLKLSDEETTVQIVFSPLAEGYRWQIFSLVTTEQAWTLHSAGEISINHEQLVMSNRSLAELKGHCPIAISVPIHYENCAEQGLNYGSEFQVVTELYGGQGVALGLVRLSDSLQVETGEYQLHPVLFDGCLQVSAAAMGSETTEAYLPFALERLQLYGAGSHQALWSYVKVRLQSDSSTQQMDITLLTETGEVVAELSGFMARTANREAILGSQLRTDWLYQLTWQPSALLQSSPYATETGHWLIISQTSQVSKTCEVLANLLRAKGEIVHSSLLTQNSELRSAVYFGGIHEGEAVPAAALRISSEVLSLVQTLIQGQVKPRLWLVSSGELATSVLWGLGRTIMWEHPELACSCLEVSAETSAESLFETLWQADKENQIRLRQGRREIARLERFNSLELATPYPCQLQLGQYGLLETLQLKAATHQQPQAHQVEVQLRAVGLNFRDVLNALGMLKEYYPPELGLADPTKLSFGFEGAGIVTAVGKNVTEFQVGDEVIVWQTWGSMASFITVEAQYVTLKPPHLSFEEAATIPLTFLTAYYGLQELAHLQAGERILIHAAAGGVGQAAIQLAQYMGAEIFATASPSKWNFLKSFGIEQVMNSRTLEFSAQIQELTAGQGVDVVLNSLNGDYIPKSFEALAEAGRFIEIGKIAIWDKAQASAYRPQAYYAPFDLGEVGQQNPAVVVTMQAKLVELFNQQILKPLPYHVFPLTQASQAFQFMAQSKHLGKVVLTIPDPQLAPPKPVQPQNSYLITGGLGGLGLKVAAWLAEQGARYLVLSGRTIGTSAQQQAIIELETLGAQVLVVKADMSQEAEVARLLAESQEFAPLRGIIHAAGVLDDGILLQQTADRFAKVFAPKVSGSWYLHQLSQHIPLDFFVSFSSVASLLGNGGQANYGAANAFMDSLMAQRQAMGLPGLSINWGAWSEVGLAEREKAKGREKLEDWIAPQQGVALFGYLLNQSATQVGVIPNNWVKFGKQLPVGANFPMLSHFLKARVVTSSKNALRQQLTQATAEERVALLKEHIRAEIEVILGVAPTDEQGFFDLGMDSLMSIQLGNRLAASLELSLPTILTLQYPTLNRLVDYLAEFFGQVKNDSVKKEEQDKIIRSVPRDQIIPLSFVQQKVWARQQMNPHGNLFNISVGVELVGQVNLTWLTESLHLIVQHQETLRTTYTSIDGVVRPQISATLDNNLTLIDISHLPEPTQSIELHRLVVETTQTPFNLSEQTWRVTLIKSAEEKYIFILCMHHMIMDGWSLALFFSEITLYYKSLSEGLPASLPPLEIQYADFAYWQRHYFTVERMASRLQYWQERLAKSAPLLELPIDKPRPPTGGMFPSNIKRFHLSVPLSQQVKAFSLRTGTTPFVTLLSAYMTLLHQISGFEQITTISPVNKRDRRALEPLIGHFSEMAILWIDLRGNPSFEELQQRVADMVLEAINQQDVPLEQVVQTLLTGNDLTKDLPYRVLFNLMGLRNNTLNLPHVRANTIELDEAEQIKMLVDLALVLWEEGEGEATHLTGWWRYRTDLFETATIDRFALQFEALLNKLVEGRK